MEFFFFAFVLMKAEREAVEKADRLAEIIGAKQTANDIYKDASTFGGIIKGSLSSCYCTLSNIKYEHILKHITTPKKRLV